MIGSYSGGDILFIVLVLALIYGILALVQRSSRKKSERG